ncbi:MAG: hypothetical protein ACPHRO_15240, partial [Nannocystaceae bacterium]
MDLQALRTELRDAGVYHRHELRSWTKFVVLLCCMLAVIAVQLRSDLWLTCALMPVAAFFGTAAVMLGHEGGHGALSSSARRNRVF